MEKQTTPKPSKKVEVPRTEVSLAQDTSNKNYLIVVGLIVGAIVLVGGYIIYRLAGQYVYQSNLNKAQDQLINSLVTKQNKFQELKTNYDAIKSPGANGVSEATFILKAVPTTKDYENLIAILEKIGQDSGVKVTNVSQGGAAGETAAIDGTAADASGNSATAFPFTVNVEGSYAAILDFLKKTEKSARVINFNSMSLNGNTGNITTNLTMTTYFKPDANIESTTVPLK